MLLPHKTRTIVNYAIYEIIIELTEKGLLSLQQHKHFHFDGNYYSLFAMKVVVDILKHQID